MEKSLIELSKKEYGLINKIKHLKGSIDEKKKQILDLKIFDDYKEIFYAYSKHNSIEGLKRAVFLQWYAVVEPEIFTGIGALERKIEEENIKKINDLILSNGLDKEFQFMLSYYYSLCDWYFDSFENNDLFKRSSMMKDSKKHESIEDMSERGQMGEYWNSLN